MLGRLGIAISALLFGMALGGAGADNTPSACGKKSSCPAAQCGKQGGCSSCPFKAAGCCPKADGCCAKDHPCDADCPKCNPPAAAEPCCPPPLPMAPPYFVGPASAPPAPPVMPHPAYGPCPVAVMPHPFPPPPTPFLYPGQVYPPAPGPWETPAAAPYYPVPHRAAMPRHYVLEMRVLEGTSGKPMKGAAAPTMLFLEGQPCTISCQGWMPADHDHGVKPAGYRTGSCGNAGCPVGCTPGCGGGAACNCDTMLRVRAVRREAGRVRLHLAFQQYEVEKSGKHGKVVYGKSVRTVQTVKLAHPTKIVLERDADGVPLLCLEVKVKRAPCPVVADAAAPCPTTPPCCAEGRPCQPYSCCERLPAPSCCHEANGEKSQDEEIAAFWNTLAEMVCGHCPCMRSSWAETAVPSGHYLPPAPAFPLSRELAYQQKVAGDTVQTYGAIRLCSEGTTVTGGGPPLRLTVEAGQVHVVLADNTTATADRLTTGPKGHIYLKGNVRVEKTGPNRRSVLIGDCMDIDMSNGSIRIMSQGGKD